MLLRRTIDGTAVHYRTTYWGQEPNSASNHTVDSAGI